MASSNSPMRCYPQAPEAPSCGCNVLPLRSPESVNITSAAPSTMQTPPLFEGFSDHGA